MMIGKPITASKKGLTPQIIVTAPTGSTVTCDGVTGVEVSGTWIFNTTIGTHTIVATLGTQSKTETVLVDEVSQYNIEISYSRLPSEYQEVEYLQSTGTQYIDTGVVPNSNMLFNITFEITSYLQEFSTVFGQRYTYNRYAYYIGYQNISYDNHSYWCRGNSKKDCYNNVNNFNRLYIRYNVYSTNLFVYNNGNSVDSFTYSGGFNNYNIFIFCHNEKGTAGEFSALKLYSFSLTDNNGTVRDFVPCYRKSDSVAGLYDLVNNVFYTNSGTGTFKVGGDV